VLHGNVKWTLIAIAGSWTLAAFGEEPVYRGYTLNRIVGCCGSRAPEWIVALVLSSCIFWRFASGGKG
jgi:CAAX protease family protein